MRIKYLAPFFLLFVLVSVSAQKTALFYLDSVAHYNQLKLCYSEDLVDLNQTIELEMDSCSLDDFLKDISFKIELKIKVKGSNLIVSKPKSETVKVTGRLLDVNTGQPLLFAHILQRDWGTGSITNSVGEFELNIPSLLVGLKLEFSSMGYADTSIVIPKSDTTGLIIYLRPKPYSINEVLVLPNGNTAQDLVKVASKKIKRTYHRKTAQLEAFYRRTGYRDSVFQNLTEAALLIEDRGIDMPPSTTKIKLQEIRKSTDYQIPMDKKYQWAFKKTEKWMFGGHRNMFYKVYGNFVRSYKQEWWFRPLTDFHKFKYEFEGAMWLDTNKVYKIKYEYDVLYPNGKRASELGNDFFGGFIYIDSKDYGIHKMTRTQQYFEGSRLYDEGVMKDGIHWNSEYSYQRINGKYYLKYKSNIDYGGNAKLAIYENPDAPDKEKKVKSRQWADEMLVITNVITERKQRGRIRIKELLDKHENSYETNYPYNPEFWETYNMVKQKPLPDKAIKELEWEKSLETQFQENSTAHVEDK